MNFPKKNFCDNIKHTSRAISAVGSASHRHCGGHVFESRIAQIRRGFPSLFLRDKTYNSLELFLFKRGANRGYKDLIKFKIIEYKQ